MNIREGLEYLFYAAIVGLINIGPPPESENASEAGEETTVVAVATPWVAPAHRAPAGFVLGHE